MVIKYYLQKLIGLILNTPIILEGKTLGYSLVKSEKSDTSISHLAKVYAPYYLHGVSIGEYTYISKNSTICDTHVGRFCSIGQNFCCGLGLHPTNGISTSPMFYSNAKQNGFSLCEVPVFQEKQHVVIGNDVFIGVNVTVLDGVTISDGAVIGAGAVVIDDIPPYAVAVGVPAKVVKYRFDKETIESLLDTKWWDWPLQDLEKVKNNFWHPEDLNLV